MKVEPSAADMPERSKGLNSEAESSGCEGEGEEVSKEKGAEETEGVTVEVTAGGVGFSSGMRKGLKSVG